MSWTKEENMRAKTNKSKQFYTYTAYKILTTEKNVYRKNVKNFNLYENYIIDIKPMY